MYKDVNWEENSANDRAKIRHVIKLQFIMIMIILIYNLG